MALAANLAFLPAIVFLWVVEGPCFESHQLLGEALVIFVIGELMLIVYYGLLIEPRAVAAVLDLLTAAARSGVPDAGGESAACAPKGAGVIQRFGTNAWTPVTLNFWLVGWLIYSTGGITTSPYSGVPLSMIIIGQSVYAIPPIQLRPGKLTPRLLVFIWSVARLYWSSLLVVVSLLGALVLLQRYLPVHRAPAPSAEVFVVTLVSLFASMCVTFVTRRGDQRERSGKQPDGDNTPRRPDVTVRPIRPDPPDYGDGGG